MSAVAEMEVEPEVELSEEERIQRVLQNYKPPVVQIGEFVFWYLAGDVNCSPRPAQVLEVKGRTITVRLMAMDMWNEGLTSVHHVSDPMLKYRPQIKNSSGSWDFSASHKLLREKFDQLEANMLVLSHAVDRVAGTRTADKVRAPEKQERLKLEALCTMHKIPWKKNMHTDELRAAWIAAGSPGLPPQNTD